MSRPLPLAASIATSFAILLGVLAGWSWFELAALEARPAAERRNYSGVLQLEGRRFRVVSSAGTVVLECPRAQCSYRDMRQDAGKHVTLTVAGDHAVEVEVDGVRRDLRQEALQSRRDTITGSVFGLIVAGGVAGFTLLRGRRKRTGI